MTEFATALTTELQPMWHFALRLTRNEADAEDLVQRTCVKALENSHRYEDKGRLRSWLFRIEHRIWLNVLRSRQIRSVGSFSGSADNSFSSNAHEFSAAENTLNRDTIVDDHSPESQMELQQIFTQVESLPDAQRLVVILVCVEGFTYSETADILEIPIGTVMSRLARARMTLGKTILADTTSMQSAEVEQGQRL